MGRSVGSPISRVKVAAPDHAVMTCAAAECVADISERAQEVQRVPLLPQALPHRAQQQQARARRRTAVAAPFVCLFQLLGIQLARHKPDSTGGDEIGRQLQLLSFSLIL